MIVRWSYIEEVNRSSFIRSTMIPSILGCLFNFEYLFIYIYIKERNERKLWLSSSVLNRFVSMELCTSESTKFLDRKGVVFDGTRRITTCPRGFRACVRDATRLTKRLLGQSSTEFRRCSILRFDTSSGLLDYQTDSPSGEWAKMRVSAWNNEQFFTVSTWIAYVI